MYVKRRNHPNLPNLPNLPNRDSLTDVGGGIARAHEPPAPPPVAAPHVGMSNAEMRAFILHTTGPTWRTQASDSTGRLQLGAEYSF